MITPLTIMIVGFLGAVTFKLINYSATGKKNIDSPINFDAGSSEVNSKDYTLGDVSIYVVLKSNGYLN